MYKFVTKNMQGSIFQQVEKYVVRKSGQLIIAEDFQKLASNSGVRTALARLVKAGKLERIAQGVYFAPKTDPIIGQVYPSIEDLARKVAKRDKVRILPTGITALNQLGLSTQVPLKQVYLTDGAPRVLRIGKSTVRFRRSSPRQMSYRGELSSLAVLALKDLGAQNVSPDILNRIGELLKKENSKDLKYDLSIAPRWIATMLKPFT